MIVNPLLGVFLHAVGGFAAGSFYTPFRMVKRWAWESYWMVQGWLAWIVMPWLAAVLTTPRLIEVLSNSPTKSLALTYVFGVLWGIGGLTFGLSMRYLGLSLGYSVALGFCAAFGTLVPPIVEGSFSSMITTTPGLTVLGGVAVCLAGIALCGRAGVRKEGELTTEQKQETIKEFALLKGFAVAIFAGVMSSCMAYGISVGKPIAAVALELGVPDIYRNTPVFILIFAGGFTTNFIWCVILNAKNRTGGDYVTGPAGLLVRNYFFAGSAGAIWYGQFFFYGMGTTRMGRYDFSSWSIHMAFIIIFSNLWGICLHEWKGVKPRTFMLVWIGIALLILSTIVIGLGNYLAE